MPTIGPRSLLNGAGAWCAVDGVCITILPMKELSQKDWLAYLDETKVLMAADNVVLRSTISYYGFDVSAQHRKAAADSVTASAQQARHVLLTDSVLLRGAIRAFSWIAPSVKVSAFAPDDWRSASRWLQPHSPHEEEALGVALRECFARFERNSQSA